MTKHRARLSILDSLMRSARAKVGTAINFGLWRFVPRITTAPPNAPVSDRGGTRRSHGGVAWWCLAAFLLLVLCLGAGLLVVRQRSLRAELDLARAAMAAGNHAAASARLSRLAARWTNDGEVFLLLGESELERARKQPPERRAEAMARSTAALAAWSKVPPASPHFGRAALLGATRLMNTGHYAPAEVILKKALAGPERSPRYELERALSRLYRFQGRFDEVRDILRSSWWRSPTPAGQLSELYALDHGPMPVEAWRRALDAADGDDERVWLGRANQAITVGRFDDASRWLDCCAARRSDETAVWQARLKLALATGNTVGFWKAVARLPADGFDAATVLSFRAWLMAVRHDEASEERELRALVAVDPGNTKALERLAALLIRLGRVKESEELHRRKAELDRAHHTYRNAVVSGGDLTSRAAELAELSAKLGRRFDSQAWSILAEAHLRNPGLAAAGLPSADESALPRALAAKAVALALPFALRNWPRPIAGSTLGDRLVALRDPADYVAARAVASARESARATPEFVDDSEPAGLRFVFDNGKTVQHLLPETMSGGVGLIDFDGDGWLDVYCAQGGALQRPTEWASEGEPAQSDRLFRNRGDGTFTDVTDASGIGVLARGGGYGMGVAVGDYDNDGHSDLFVTRLRTYALYRNRGDGTFEDNTASAGLAGVRDISTSAAFADLDKDGDLDLYVCHYMAWDPEHPRLCVEKAEYVYCDPSTAVPAADHLFRNDGGHFIDVTASSGCAETDGRGLGVVAADFDGDGLLDLFIANDGTANYLFRNLGGLRFEEVGQSAGVAANASGGYQAGMGVACGDWDGDGLIDLAVTNFYGESTTLFRNLGDGFFADHTAAAGLAAPSRHVLGFGAAFLDADNDGHLDVMTANGNVNDQRPFFPYAMTAQLYQGKADGRLTDVTSLAGPPFRSLHVGRGLAVGDLDNDGRMDAVLVAQNEPIVYLHNRTENSSGHYVSIQLRGTTSNRDGVGASVAVTAGGQKQVAQRFGGGSYLSAGDPRLHFGLGAAGRIDRIEIRWPSGQVDVFENVPLDRRYRVTEGTRSLCRKHGIAEMTMKSVLEHMNR
jgi:tetratricopeptide (TPR) repeat protein